MIKGYFDTTETLITLQQIRQVIGNITKNDFRDDIQWLKHLRFVAGYLDDSIRELERLLKNE